MYDCIMIKKDEKSPIHECSYLIAVKKITLQNLRGGLFIKHINFSHSVFVVICVKAVTLLAVSHKGKQNVDRYMLSQLPYCLFSK